MQRYCYEVYCCEFIVHPNNCILSPDFDVDSADRDMVDVAEEKLWSVRAATDEAEHQPKSVPSMDVEIDDIISVVDVYW